MQRKLLGRRTNMDRDQFTRRFDSANELENVFSKTQDRFENEKLIFKNSDSYKL